MNPLNPTVDDIKSCTTLLTLNYGHYGLFLVMGNAGFISQPPQEALDHLCRRTSGVPHRAGRSLPASLGVLALKDFFKFRAGGRGH